MHSSDKRLDGWLFWGIEQLTALHVSLCSGQAFLSDAGFAAAKIAVLAASMLSAVIGFCCFGAPGGVIGREERWQALGPINLGDFLEIA